MAKIDWSIKGLFKADAEKVDKEIKGIGGQVTPEMLVGYARAHKQSELYKCFEWDDAVAGEKYRLSQAQKVIQCLVVMPEKGEPKIREYQITTQRNTYAPSRTFLVNKDEYSALLERAVNELKSFRQRYQNLSELEMIFAEIDTL